MRKDKNQAMLLSQYKIMVNSSIKVSEWRQNANKFYLTLNTTIASLMGALHAIGYPNLIYILPVFGIVISLIWYLHLEEFKKLNKAKFKVINRLEKKLPSKPFDDEWQYLAKAKYKEITNLEKYIPIIFLLIFIIYLLIIIIPLAIRLLVNITF